MTKIIKAAFILYSKHEAAQMIYNHLTTDKIA